MVYLYIAALLVLAGIEGKPLLRNKKWSELLVFSFLMIAGTVVIAMNTASFEPYRVSVFIDVIFRPYTNLVKNFLTRF